MFSPLANQELKYSTLDPWMCHVFPSPVLFINPFVVGCRRWHWGLRLRDCGRLRWRGGFERTSLLFFVIFNFIPLIVYLVFESYLYRFWNMCWYSLFSLSSFPAYFSDGVGVVSRGMVGRIMRRMRLPTQFIPSAFQVGEFSDQSIPIF